MVGGLGGNQEGMELGFEIGGEERQIRGEAEKAQKVQSFLGGDGVGVEDDPVGATDLIGQHPGLFLHEFLAGVVFQFDELADNLDQTVENLFFRLAEGGLVGDLEKIA